MNIPAADLNRGHLGLLVLVDIGGASIEDTLSGVSHQADLIEERKLMDEVRTYGLGRISTVLSFTNAGEVTVAGTTPIHLLMRGPRG
jgi:hypothetical protein